MSIKIPGEQDSLDGPKEEPLFSVIKNVCKIDHMLALDE